MTINSCALSIWWYISFIMIELLPHEADEEFPTEAEFFMRRFKETLNSRRERGDRRRRVSRDPHQEWVKTNNGRLAYLFLRKTLGLEPDDPETPAVLH